MLLASITLALIFGCVGTAGDLHDRIATARELYTNTFAKTSIGATFDCTATVTFISTRLDDRPNAADSRSVMMGIEDRTGATIVYDYSDRTIALPRPGDRVRLAGFIGRKFGYTRACCTNVLIQSHEEAPVPTPALAADFLHGEVDCRLVRIEGIIRDVFEDEIDPRWTYLALSSHGQNVSVAFVGNGERMREELIGAEAAVVGICDPASEGSREQFDRVLITDASFGITIVRAAATDAAPLPEQSGVKRLRTSDINSLGLRRVSGRVLAVWQGNNILLRTDAGKIMRIELSRGSPPSCDADIEVVGLPTTDLFSINFTHATWSQSRIVTSSETNDTEIISLKDLLLDRQGRTRFNTAYHGKSVQLRGIVRSLPTSQNDGGRFILESGRFNVAIDVSMTPNALKGLPIGTEIEVIGVCLMETDNWRSNALFPRVKGFTIILRKEADLHIIKRPSWWTAGRLMAVIGALLVGLAGTLVWNTLLRNIVNRKSRALLREQLGHVKAELKTEERTRLAVELHDSLAQNLTGVSLEIDTASKVADEDPFQMKAHLGIAARSLKSCRDELRNCLWDLRNRALEERTMDEAIRQTLAPHAVGIDLAIRFNVPRERISDNTAHAILRIIRELTLNGIRHGGATKIRIAGSVEGERMLFSVRDNGCGFDPDAAPGFSEGHYGLVGIRERVDEFEGEFTLASSPGKGTKATVSLKIPQEN